LAIPTTANAHFKLVAPEAEYTQTTLGDPQKTAPCGPTGDGGTATNQVTTVMSGSMLTVSLNETVYHPGHYRVSIAQTEAGLPAEPPVTAGTTQCGSVPIDSNPTLPVLADGVLVHTSAFSGQQTAQVQLPAGMTCTNCVVQVLEFMSNHPAPCFYHHCAIVNVTTTGQAPDAGVGGDAGTDPGGSGGCNSGRGVGPGIALLLLALLLRRRR
ncbi:MAG TPA: SCE4755 family polysaccharide monooxygenase-like protein, partial [Kofleriaceae bacterium]